MIHAPGFPEEEVRDRARRGRLAIFPDGPGREYGSTAFGQEPAQWQDEIDRMRIVPPIFSDQRLAKLVELGREPYHSDVDLTTNVGGFRSRLPVYVSALGSTSVAHSNVGEAVARQAGESGIPLVVGENVRTVHGYAHRQRPGSPSFKERVQSYAEALPEGLGGLVVQQSVEDANSELWNQVYSDPDFEALLSTGRLGFELKVGQGAKPGLGGLTLVGDDEGRRLADAYRVEPLETGLALRCSSAGTFTPEILANQLRLMRNNYPRAKIWLKLHPGRDLPQAVQVATRGDADAIVIDGGEGGSGLAPTAFLQSVGLPLFDALRSVGRGHQILASGRIWEATRLVKLKALGATGCGIGRAALIAASVDDKAGLRRFLEGIDLELRLLVSALGKYDWRDVGEEDAWRLEGHVV